MMRAVIVYDIEIDGSLKDAASLDDELNSFARGFQAHLSTNNPELKRKMNFTQINAAVPLQERRGATGSLDDIVFRGSRGPNKPKLEVKTDLPSEATEDQKDILFTMRKSLKTQGYDDKRIQWYINEGLLLLKYESMPATALMGKLDLIEKAKPKE